MRIDITSTLDDQADRIRDLIRYAHAGEMDGPDVEVHVKRARPDYNWLLPCDDDDCDVNYWANPDVDPSHAKIIDRYGGVHRGHLLGTRRDTLTRCRHDRRPSEARKVEVGRATFSGYAYSRMHSTANVAPGTRWLVTLTIPHPDDGPPYPRQWTYHRAKTATQVIYRSWDEDVVHLAAHEARHLMQYARDLPRSEVDAENYAASVLFRWRDDR